MKNTLAHTQSLLNKEIFTRKEIIVFVESNRLIEDLKAQWNQITALLIHIITIDYLLDNDVNKSTVKYLTHNKKNIITRIKYDIRNK
jgi:hypothetical protein